MRNKLLSQIKSIFKPLLVLALILTLTLGDASSALAARSGGRIGGGSFRAPSRTYSAPSRTYAPPGGGYYPAPYPGGGFGLPFLFPFFGIGGGFGGLFTILIFISLANFLFQTFRRVTSGDGSENNTLSYGSPKVSVAKVQVGLLAQARSLQTELNEIAAKADTGTDTGRAEVLQEASLALLRHPEYWVYGSSQSQQMALEAAEAKFNQMALAERSKLSAETLSNVNNQLRQASLELPASNEAGQLAERLQEGPGEYIVVTILVGSEGNMQLPVINGSDDLRQALRQIGGVSGDRLLAVEILWEPQAEGDTLTSDEIIAEYPDLKLV